MQKLNPFKTQVPSKEDIDKFNAIVDKIFKEEKLENEDYDFARSGIYPYSNQYYNVNLKPADLEKYHKLIVDYVNMKNYYDTKLQKLEKSKNEEIERIKKLKDDYRIKKDMEESRANYVENIIKKLAPNFEPVPIKMNEELFNSLEQNNIPQHLKNIDFYEIPIETSKLGKINSDKSVLTKQGDNASGRNMFGYHYLNFESGKIKIGSYDGNMHDITDSFDYITLYKKVPDSTTGGKTKRRRSHKRRTHKRNRKIST